VCASSSRWSVLYQCATPCGSDACGAGEVCRVRQVDAGLYADAVPSTVGEFVCESSD
jgi:hypothetical protein